MESNTVHSPKKVFDPMWNHSQPCRLDLRNIDTGNPIPAQFYADQPYLTQTQDGGILCVITTGRGHEGAQGQNVLCMKTFDKGSSWQTPVAIEPPNNPEASWGVPFTAPSGRIFIFYIYNADNLRELPADNPPYPEGKTQRMDSHGYYVFRWSDDHGSTWSQQRGVIPVREFEIDRSNPTGGAVRLFWNVGKPFAHEGSLYLPIHKVGGFGEGWFTRSEGGLLRSDDILLANDPLQVSWETLPLGEQGIRAPSNGGPIAEEHSFVPLSDGSFFTVFRTIDGHPACSYSRDCGQTWEPSQYMRFANGRLIKHPRAANFVWRTKEGSYLYCFHNHGGKYLREHPGRKSFSYLGRNPMWMCRGWEIDGTGGKKIEWSEPEILLYADDPMLRISYPDCMEIDGSLLFTETQKSAARIHRIPNYLTDALSSDMARRAHRLQGTKPLLRWQRKERGDAVTAMPELAPFVVRSNEPPYGMTRTREGFSVHFQVVIHSAASSVLAANTAKDGSGFLIEWSGRRTIRLWMSDGSIEVSWESDAVDLCRGEHTFTINVDGGSNTICIYHNGTLNDGADERPYGWGRCNPYFCNVYLAKELRIPDNSTASLNSLAIYHRILTSAEIAILTADTPLVASAVPAQSH